MLETLEKVHNYLNENKLVLNVDKKELIVFGETNILEQNINRAETKTRKGTCQDLGVLVDKNLNFSAELTKCSRKMAVAIKSIYPCLKLTE